MARRDKEARFTALLHHVDLDRLRAAYWAISPKAAAGVDGVTWESYGQDLEANLRGLHERVHSGRYRARPSRRAYIPKADGRLRPLGIAALEDKVLQRAVVEVLNAVYETDFLGFSYGFRPGRGPHAALDALSAGIYKKRVNWVLDADIRDFFGQIDQSWLRRFLEHRIADKRVLRLVDKWLSAGVIEDGTWSQTVEGSPQGASVSPLLANVYLHHVLDQWVEWWRRKYARGDVIIVRFADDFTAGFEHLGDAKQFMRDLRERFAKFSLQLHPDKTRLIEFGRFAARRRAERGLGKPETFDFLGLTHICGKTRGGRFWLRRITVSKRMRAKLREVKDQLKQRRHEPVPEQGRWLGSVIRGHLAYYAVPGNVRAVRSFRKQVTRHWFAALRSRSQRHRLNWVRMNRLATRWLQAPVQQADGSVLVRDRGTPQGSAVSPVLANLFLHYAFDAWMAREFPGVVFERYVDDAVVHCVSESQARMVLAAIAERMEQVGLRLHPDKTRIVYCQDGRRRASYEHTEFTYLGFTFRQRRARAKSGRQFNSFLPAISKNALKKINAEVQSWRLHNRIGQDLADVARDINPIVRGWMEYYGAFYRSAMYPLLSRINAYLVRWIRKKYKRLRAKKKAFRCWRGIVKRCPRMFAHWMWVPSVPSVW